MSTTHEPANEREPHYENPDAVLFDRFARSAGASLRSEAPDDGMTALVRRGNRQRARHLAIEIGVVGVMVLAGVALLRRSDDDQPAINPDPVPTTEDGATPIVSADDPRVSQWVLNYTGNPVGPASGEPVKFGIVMQPFAYEYALNAAATYLNEQAGGVGGRPVELDSCQETIADCIERFATDPTIIAVPRMNGPATRTRIRLLILQGPRWPDASRCIPPTRVPGHLASRITRPISRPPRRWPSRPRR